MSRAGRTPRRARPRRGLRARAPGLPDGARRSGSTPRTPPGPPAAGARAGSRSRCRRSPSSTGRGAAGYRRSSVPDVLERTEAQLLLVVVRGVVDAPHVLVAVLGDERVVALRRLPAIDYEIAPRHLDVAQQLGADVALAAAEELRPLAVRAVDALELLRHARLVREHERDHAAETNLPRDGRRGSGHRGGGTAEQARRRPAVLRAREARRVAGEGFAVGRAAAGAGGEGLAGTAVAPARRLALGDHAAAPGGHPRVRDV